MIQKQTVTSGTGRPYVVQTGRAGNRKFYADVLPCGSNTPVKQFMAHSRELALHRAKCWLESKR